MPALQLSGRGGSNGAVSMNTAACIRQGVGTAQRCVITVCVPRGLQRRSAVAADVTLGLAEFLLVECVQVIPSTPTCRCLPGKACPIRPATRIPKP